LKPLRGALRGGGGSSHPGVWWQFVPIITAKDPTEQKNPVPVFLVRV